MATLGLQQLRELRAEFAAAKAVRVAAQQAPSSPEFPRRVAAWDDVRAALPWEYDATYGTREGACCLAYHPLPVAWSTALAQTVAAAPTPTHQVCLTFADAPADPEEWGDTAYDQLQALGYWSQQAYGPQVAGWDC